MEGVCIVCGCSFTPVNKIVDSQKMNFSLHATYFRSTPSNRMANSLQEDNIHSETVDSDQSPTHSIASASWE